jgi:hypothetical protein
MAYEIDALIDKIFKGILLDEKEIKFICKQVFNILLI